MKNIARSKWILSLFLFLFSSVSFADYVNTKVEFSAYYNPVNGPGNVVHFNGNTYLVWLDANFRPWVTRKFKNKITTAALEAPDYAAFPDGHHYFTMGIDKNGYLHVTGDMHYYPGGPNGNAHMPTRLQNQTIMYWVSNKPYDPQAGFTFAGGKNATTAIPGTAWVSGRFFNDKNGELYYASMVRAYDNPNYFLQGMAAVGLYKYDTVSHTWTAFGGKADATTPAGTTYYTVFYWENSGFAPAPNWFQNYQPSFHFDNNNRLHFAVTGNTDVNLNGASRLLYARSDDNGKTWFKANGAKIPAFPLRGADTSANVADVVVDTKGASYLGPVAVAIADANGKPIVSVDNKWYRWNGTAWVNDVSGPHKLSGNAAYLGPDGVITTIEPDTIFIRRAKVPNIYSSAYRLQSFMPNENYHYFVGISDIGFKQTGSLYGVAINDSNLKLVQVIKVDFKTSSLPTGWASTDVGETIVSGGATDYKQGVFTLRGQGGGVRNNTDEFQFAYRSLTGDGTIVAQVVSQDVIASQETDGVMMRETLDPNSATAFMGVSYANGNQFVYRTAKNATASMVTNWDGKAPYWVKLERIGNVFNGYVAPDGISWKLVSSQTIPMANTIYVGLAGFSFNGLEVHTATVDNVKLLPLLK